MSHIRLQTYLHIVDEARRKRFGLDLLEKFPVAKELNVEDNSER